MRKNKKAELLDCLDSLNQINDEIDSIPKEEQKELLTLCQEMAVEMGTLIEKWEGVATKAVTYLELYCEEIYKLYNDETNLNLKESYDQIHKLLDLIRESINNIKITPFEILFLPYKAAMWDSLESIYLASSKQSDCHVTVMPIPYYNINPKKEILSVEYEGSLFSKELTIIDYRDYDLKIMEPDVIFIHNPYDQYNYVIQVAENFYSTELMKYTSRLVYIPYFVTSDNKVASHYCLQPGVKNAWRTFVQSEGVKLEYQQYLFNKERIVALGSPKFDKVKELEQNLSRVPEAWSNIFKGKIVFLLNTHLHSIINQSEIMLEKLWLIFEFFHQHKEIVLLWRPHPLSIETAKSLNPMFLDSYMGLIEKFKSLSIGVYDESPDIHRAISITDAYIGNISSIVPMYGVTSKPIYLFDSTLINIFEREKQISNRDEEIITAMKNIEDKYKFLYDEAVVPLEYYIELVKNGKDLCKEERISRFLKLQHEYNNKQSAGERIWEYIYKDITKTGDEKPSIN